MDYKPYTLEWSRKRYLNEAIQKYFNDGESAETVVDDILDCLSETISYHKNRSEKMQIVMDAIGELHNEKL